jgi:hypothetical protein
MTQKSVSVPPLSMLINSPPAEGACWSAAIGRGADFGAQAGHDRPLSAEANAKNTAVGNAPDRWGVIIVSSPYSARLPPKIFGVGSTLGQHRARRAMSARYCPDAGMTPPERVVFVE